MINLVSTQGNLHMKIGNLLQVQPMKTENIFKKLHMTTENRLHTILIKTKNLKVKRQMLIIKRIQIIVIVNKWIPKFIIWLSINMKKKVNKITIFETNNKLNKSIIMKTSAKILSIRAITILIISQYMEIKIIFNFTKPSKTTIK